MVAQRFRQLERHTHFETSGGCTSDNRRISNWLGQRGGAVTTSGSGSQVPHGSAGIWNMGQAGHASVFKFPGTAHDPQGPGDVWSQVARKMHSVPVRQHCHCGASQQTFGRIPATPALDQNDIQCCDQSPDYCAGKALGREVQQHVRQTLQDFRQTRVETAPGVVQDHQSVVGATQRRQVCLSGKCTAAHLQLQVPGSTDVRGRCHGPMLDRVEQLVEPSLLHDRSGVEEGGTGQVLSNPGSTDVEITELVSQFSEIVRVSTISTTSETTVLPQNSRNPRAKAQLGVENLRLEDIWRDRLISEGWNTTAATTMVHSKATSTWRTYDRAISKCAAFVSDLGFTLQDVPDNVLANYVCFLATQSARPQSLLRTFSAAFRAFGQASGSGRALSEDVFKVIDGLIKTRTMKPLKRTEIMPVAPFLQLFRDWVENSSLTLLDLRTKAVTLLSLCAMLRPSDIAIRSGYVFKRSMVRTLPDGHLEIYLHGIKNDYKRDGFRLVLPCASDAQVCPVLALTVYMARTAIQSRVKTGDGPVFMTIKPPFKALCAGEIGHILSMAIEAAGLCSIQFKPKNFRPTGATNAIDFGAKPDQVQSLGHWMNRETFLKHYVHCDTDLDFTDKVLGITTEETHSIVGNKMFKL